MLALLPGGVLAQEPDMSSLEYDDSEAIREAMEFAKAGEEKAEEVVDPTLEADDLQEIIEAEDDSESDERVLLPLPDSDFFGLNDIVSDSENNSCRKIEENEKQIETLETEREVYVISENQAGIDEVNAKIRLLRNEIRDAQVKCDTEKEFAIITNIKDPGLRGLVYLLLWIYDLGRYVLGSVILIFASVATYHMVTSNGNDEDISRAKRFFLWSAFGMVIFSLSWAIKDIFLIQGESFFLQGDNIEKTASAFSNVIYYILEFFRYALGGVAVYFITASGLKLVSFSESDDIVSQQKKVFVWGLLGLIIFMVSGEIVTTLYGHQTESGDIVVNPDQYSGYDLIIGISEFLLYFIGAIALLAMVFASISYIASGENDGMRETSKKIIIGSITGIVIAYSSFTIVSEIIGAIS